eukprot:686593-Pelagomonas_calceolata.AAC.2
MAMKAGRHDTHEAQKVALERKTQAKNTACTCGKKLDSSRSWPSASDSSASWTWHCSDTFATLIMAMGRLLAK